MVNRSGQALVEYVIMLVVVAMALIAALTHFGTALEPEVLGDTVEECASPGQGGYQPGKGGGTPRGQCLKAK
jgi:hypothetical protein